MRARFFLSCLFGFLCVLPAACSKRATAESPPPLRISQRNEPATLDAQLATLPDEFFVIRALSEGLLVPSPDGGNPLPGVAEKWEVSGDGLSYIFHFRAEARWSNGDPVTARDFAWSIQRILTPALAAPKARLFFALKNAEAFYRGREKDFSSVGVHVVDDHTLRLELARPDADFPAIVASGPWIPVHRAAIERFGRQWTEPGHFIGNGPFTLTRAVPQQVIAVTRNPQYRGGQSAQVAAIDFLAFDNGDSEERAFRAGQVDVTMAVPFSKLAPYRAANPSPLHTVPLHETRYLALNVRRPPLDDVRVRRALALALDRGTLVEKVLQGGQPPAFNFVPAGLGGYAPDTLIHENADEARRLLAEAGFPGGRGFPALELATWPVATAQIEAIQQRWRDVLGIEVPIAQREARVHLASLVSGDYALAFVTAIPDYDGASDFFSQLRSDNPLNYPHWRNPDYDRLVDAAGHSTDPARRLAAYRQAEKILLGEMPVIPLYFNAQNFLVAPRVQGWKADRLWTRFYSGVSLAR